jgi:NAD-reducing hydrogenase small subunit
MPHAPRKLKVATVSLAGCFGCHMSFLDIDERLFELVEHIEFGRSPLTDIKTVEHCDIGLVEGGLCNAENVHVLRDFRAQCKTLVAVGACAITGGLPAQRNHLNVGRLLVQVYSDRHGLAAGSPCPTTRSCRCRSTGCTPSTKWCTSTTSCPAVRPRPMPSGPSSAT